MYNERLQIGYLEVQNRPLVNGTGVLLSGEALNRIISTNYSNLTGLKAANKLIPGQFYRISDFHLMWYNQSINDTGVKSGLAPEPLIVLALSGNKISHEAKSELYPQDTVYYDIDAVSSYSWGTINNNLAIPNFKGWIYRRVDHKLNIDIGWDWRNITVNCCRPIVTGIPMWTGTTNYNKFDIVRGIDPATTGKLYYSILKSNSGISLTNTNWWLPVSDFTEGSTYFPTNESIGFMSYINSVIFTLLPDTSTRIQQPTFTSSLTSKGTFALTNCKNIKIDGGDSNVIIGYNFCDNIIGDSFTLNTIKNDFRSNNLGNNFYFNIIGSSFQGNNISSSNINNIGSNFYNNTIKNSFGNNIIGNNFITNFIGDSLSFNTIGQFFSSNTIGNNFISNTIGNSFQRNKIGNQFAYNIISNSFLSNTIGNHFSSNTISSFFSMNLIGNSFSSNTGDLYFQYNVIGNDFQLNTIGSNFYYNTIANDFVFNKVGNVCNSNTIGNVFMSNIIGDYFNMNTVEDYLSIGNVTGSTHIYNQYNTRLFKNSNQTVRLSYFNNSDQLVVTDPTA